MVFAKGEQGERFAAVPRDVKNTFALYDNGRLAPDIAAQTLLCRNDDLLPFREVVALADGHCGQVAYLTRS